MGNEIILFETNDNAIKLEVPVEGETVWLSANQMAELFDRDEKTIRKHINNVFSEAEVDKYNNTQKMRVVGVKQKVPFYTLDVIISVGYRVKSKRGVLFRKWANGILKKYLIKGYVVNDRHFQDIDYVTKMLDQYRNAGGKLPSSTSMLEFLKAYQRGFKILDDYDHHQLEVPLGQKDTYVLHYDECMKLIHNTMFDNKGDLFSIERDDSFRSSISTIYQSFGDIDLYPTLEDKASALLYFIVKNHSFIDGNKRIGATIFLYFLNMNNALYKNGMERINNDALATLTILVASSRPEDKEIMMQLIKTILK